MSVVSPELGVGTLERRVSVRLRLLDTVRGAVSAAITEYQVYRILKPSLRRKSYRIFVERRGGGSRVPVLVVLLSLVVLGRVL